MAFHPGPSVDIEMGEASSSSRQDECNLCLEGFKSPRILPCFHTFCLQCLNQLTGFSSMSYFACPTCRANIQVPFGGVEKFQVNFYLEENANANRLQRSSSIKDTRKRKRLEEKRYCDVCIENKLAVKGCFECDQALCAACLKVHSSLAVTRSHREFISIKSCGEGSSSSSLPNKEPENQSPIDDNEKYVRLCEVHIDEALRFYCIPCLRVICRDCKLTSHEGHATIDLTSKMEDACNLASSFVSKARENLQPHLSQMIMKAIDHQKDIQDSRTKFELDMKTRAEQLKSLVDDLLEKSLKDLNEIASEFNDTLTSSITIMEDQFSQMNIMIRQFEQFIYEKNECCTADIMSVPGQVDDFLSSVQKTDKLGIFLSGKWPYSWSIETSARNGAAATSASQFSFSTGSSSPGSVFSSAFSRIRTGQAHIQNEIRNFIGSVRYTEETNCSSEKRNTGFSFSFSNPYVFVSTQSDTLRHMVHPSVGCYSPGPEGFILGSYAEVYGQDRADLMRSIKDDFSQIQHLFSVWKPAKRNSTSAFFSN